MTCLEMRKAERVPPHIPFYKSIVILCEIAFPPVDSHAVKAGFQYPPENKDK